MPARQILTRAGKIMLKAGKVMTATADQLAEACECCDGLPCDVLYLAERCYITTDENCNVNENLGFYVCSKSYCEHAEGDRFEDGGSFTIKVGEDCFHVQNTNPIDPTSLPDGTIIPGITAYQCATSCSEESECSQTFQTGCECQCYAYYGDSVFNGNCQDPEPDELCSSNGLYPPGGHRICCYGKVDETGVNPNWNWSYSRVVHGEKTSTEFVPNIPISCNERDCIANADCVVLHYEQDSAGVTEFGRYGCCLEQNMVTDVTVDRGGCCDNPNTASGLDYYTHTRCAYECPRMSCTIICDYVVPGHGPGCLGGVYFVTTENADCSSYSHSVHETQYGSHSYDGENCACLSVWEYTDEWEYLWSGGSSDIDQKLCSQCLTYLDG